MIVNQFSRKAKNPRPYFSAPKHHKARPGVIRRWQSWTESKPVHLWTGFQLLKVSGSRSRNIRPERQVALAATVQAMLHHLNLVTHQVEACVETLADTCALSTVSKAGNKSITRVSRLINDLLEPAGLVTTEKVWDKNLGCWIPKYIEVQPLFFEMLGISMHYVEKEQARRQAYAQKLLVSDSEAGLLSISELKHRAKLHHINQAFKRRKQKLEEKSQKRLASRLKGAESTHGYHEVDNEIALGILRSLPQDELARLTPAKLKELVNRRKAFLKAIVRDKLS
ncbi:plasmid replication initiator RepA [Bowmanella yangjiangensis]|uniref:Replication initiation protein n=1 Tax=Bowmanella yangjiangensis TaxID=2811230 RepID=A0ABS3CQF2_9ALTE|nr:plasmid replication initiator RepA [Bowmanella yangjiangensis]MBN7819321.1 hypothetical protein [Bowmanella yangjiangensis]